jgi:acylphosphatase
MLELQVTFSGAVQGVGFRAMAKRLADEFQLTGYVKNLSNGTVELVAQGTKENLEHFLSALKEKFNVHEVTEKYIKPSSSYRNFSIHFTR